MSLSNFSSSFHLQELSRRPFITSPTLAGMDLRVSSATIRILYGRAGNFGHRFHGLKLWIQKNLSTRLCDNRKHGQENIFKTSKFLDSNHSTDLSRKSLICKDQVQDKPDSTDETRSLFGGSSASTWSPRTILSDRSLNVMQTHSLGFAHKEDGVMPISIAIIGATGDLSKMKIFPALFALYYSGFLTENVRIFGYSEEKLTDEDLRSIIAATLTCRVDHQANSSNQEGSC